MVPERAPARPGAPSRLWVRRPRFAHRTGRVTIEIPPAPTRAFRQPREQRTPLPRIRLEQVSKSYGSTEVIPGLDLELDDGEFTVLVGPSGCGKSTTLRMLAGLEEISDGEIFFDERPISRLEPKARDVAMVFQDYALYPHMNIAKNMSFALRLARTPKRQIEARVREVARILNITELLARKPAELSGGQRQRVAMGRAMVRDAGTFLFDEPLSNLDAKLRARMRTELAEMRDRLDKNMVYVTHDQIEAMTLGDRIVVMRDGVVQQQGAPETLFKDPANRFVAGFIGSPRMNLLDARAVDEGGSMLAAGDGFRIPLSAAQANALRARPGGADAVVLGIRPSVFVEPDAPGAHALTLRVVVAEYLGAQSVLMTRLGSAEVLVERASDSPVRGGTTLGVGVRSEDVLLFDAADGLRIRTDGARVSAPADASDGAARA